MSNEEPINVDATQFVTTGVLKQIPVDRLVLDADYNPRLSGTQAAHVRRLLESDPDDWPPIIVTPWDDSTYLILDGSHRYSAAIALGRQSLLCRVIEGGGYPEAFEANRQHGLPLASPDRKVFAVWLRDEYPDLSLREIARRCGLHHNTVKAHFEGADDEVGPAPRTKPVADKLVSLVIRATDRNEGIGLFNRDKRAELLREHIDSYDNDLRTDVAHALHVWGRAMQSAATAYLKPD